VAIGRPIRVHVSAGFLGLLRGQVLRAPQSASARTKLLSAAWWHCSFNDMKLRTNSSSSRPCGVRSNSRTSSRPWKKKPPLPLDLGQEHHAGIRGQPATIEGNVNRLAGDG
jgi:hypothetical protein